MRKVGWALAMAMAGSATTAGASTLTTSYATWAANAGSGQVNTQTTGQYTPTDIFATVSSVALPAGAVGLSDPNTVVVRTPADPIGSFPFSLSNGFTGDLFLPSGSSITLQPPSTLGAFGFYVATYSNASVPAGAGYTITVTLAGGASQSFSTAGGSFSTGITPAGFFGYYGGPVSSLTITDSDPQGFAFGDFFSVRVPEPASVSALLGGLVVVGLAGVMGRRRPA